MDERKALHAATREEHGKNAMRRLRSAGHTPAVLYGGGQDSVSLKLETKPLRRVMDDPIVANYVIDFAVDGGSPVPARLVDWILDPVSGELLHADFQRLDLEKPVLAHVPVRGTGVSRGVREEGGSDSQVSRTIKVRAVLPQIPEVIEVSVEEMVVGDLVRVRDLPESDDYEIADIPSRVVLRCEGKKAETEEPEEGEETTEEAAEPAESAE